jgi:uncharacterized membrane protein
MIGRVIRSFRGEWALRRAVGLSCVPALLLVLSACADMSPSTQRMASGTMIGAGSGAVIGAIAGNAGMGAGIGAGAGLLGGYLYDQHEQSKQQAYEQGYAQGQQGKKQNAPWQ